MEGAEIFRKTISTAVLAIVLLSVFVIEVPENGNAQVTEEWVARYNGPGNLWDEGKDITFDSSGNVYVTGRSYGWGTDFACTTIKYDSDGNEIWAARYNGPTNLDDGANAITLDSTGNVYLTGYSWDNDNFTDCVTIKYDPSGNELWVERYNGPANHHDAGSEIILDSSGNVYVIGSSHGIGTNDDYITIKYDPDGNNIWVARYDGPGIDNPYDIAIDQSGNAYVTGRSRCNGSWYDYTTIKYDSLGNQMWVARYNGPGNYNDAAYAITIDPAENL